MNFYGSDVFNRDVEYSESSGGMLDEFAQSREPVEWRPSALLRLSAAVAISGLVSLWVPGTQAAASNAAATLSRAVATGGVGTESEPLRPFSSPRVSEAAKRRAAVMDRLFVQSAENDFADPDHGI